MTRALYSGFGRIYTYKSGSDRIWKRKQIRYSPNLHMVISQVRFCWFSFIFGDIELS